MLRRCVLTVFTETDSSLAISGRDRFVGRYRSTLSSPGLSSSVGGNEDCSLAAGDEPCRTSRMSASSAACAVSMPRQRLEQLGRAGHRERQDQPVGLGQGQRAFGRLVRRALVTELAVGEPGQQVSLHDRDVPEDRCRAIQNIGHRVESRGRIAFREADHRAGVTDLAGAGPLVIERRERGAGLAGHPEAGLGGQQPAGHLARQRLRARQLRSQVFGRAELLERLVVAAAAGVQHPGRLVQQQPDVRPGVCLQGLFGALQPSLALVELTRPDHRAGERDQRGRDHRFRAPAVSLGERDRLAAAPLGRGERADLRCEPELRQAADFEVGPADLPGQGGALPEVAFGVRQRPATTPRRSPDSSAPPRAGRCRARCPRRTAR